jgi:carbon storage regulator
MLVLTRKLGEQIVLPDSGVLVTVLGISGNRVRLGVAAPANQRVHRREIWERSQRLEDSEDPPVPRDTPTGPRPPRRLGGAELATGPAATLAHQRQLADRIEQWTGGRIRGLRVERDGDRLVVYGRSDSYYAWQLAQAAVAEFRDVMSSDRPIPLVTLDLQVVWPLRASTSGNDSSAMED